MIVFYLWFAVESDGDYFEVMPDGTIRLKAGKKKIDINKLTDDDLRRLGIDPRNMTKEEIARRLKVRYPKSRVALGAARKRFRAHVNKKNSKNPKRLWKCWVGQV